MNKILLLPIIFFANLAFSFGQSSENLRTQLEYCKKESAKSESNVDTYKKLLEIQGSQIMELKTKNQNLETEIANLKIANAKLESVSLELVELGTKYEELGKFQEAIEVYKLLIRSFPSSMQAIASKLRVIDLKKKEGATATNK